MSSDSTPYREPLRPAWLQGRSVPGWLQGLWARPELLAVAVVAGALNLWGLAINGWANTYYSAAVRSMTTSWHDFLFASLDKTGLMTVDKPPLALWVQALSARIFGFHPLSILVPQALMGAAAAALTYDLTRRRFGRPAGFAAGIALATTPIAVAMSRHNNPDELLVLCCVAALWFAVRALEDGRTRWLVWCGVCVGLGFETKMAVALFVVPGIALAYLWVAPRGRLAALRQLTAGGVALAVVGLAWPILVTLTPAADRPWISGTADNSIWSLIFNYNGVGRVTGQTGAPGAGFGGGGGGGGGAFGGATGVFRLLSSGLGDQAGWLLGFAVVAGLGVLVASRLRRSDPRTGWLIAVGGAFLVSAVVFSYASGIFHPYYVSFLAPFTAMLIGAGVGEALGGGRVARIAVPAAIVAGAVTELVVLGNLSGDLAWARPLIIAAAGVSAILLAAQLAPRVRAVVVGVALAALLAAPATWAARDHRACHRRHVPGRRAGQRAERRLRRGGRGRVPRLRRPACLPLPGRWPRGRRRARRRARRWLRLSTAAASRACSPTRRRARAASGAVASVLAVQEVSVGAQAVSVGAQAALAAEAAPLAATRPASTRPSNTPRPTAAAPSASRVRAAPHRRSSPATPTSPAWAASPVARAR